MDRMLAGIMIIVAVALTAGCIEGLIKVTDNNVHITYQRYSGDCMPPTTRTPCCQPFDKPNTQLVIDGTMYFTDDHSKLDLQIAKDNATHIVEFKGCEGDNQTMEFTFDASGKVVYERIKVFSNAAYETQTVASADGNIELNLPCCTA